MPDAPNHLECEPLSMDLHLSTKRSVLSELGAILMRLITVDLRAPIVLKTM